MHKHDAIVFAIGLTLSVTAAAEAQDWPSFRGPNASGIADAHPLPVSWDGEKSTNILWKTPLEGLGHSSPVVWGDRVFVTAATSAAGNRNHNPKDEDIQPANDDSVHQWRVYSLDKRTGKILWSRTAHQGVPTSEAAREGHAGQRHTSDRWPGRRRVIRFGRSLCL